MWVNIQRITGVPHCANVVWPDLEQKERHWIKTYGTLSPDGYNTSPGGESGGSLTKPTMVDGLRFDSVTQAAAYVSKTRQISLVAAEARIRNNRIDVKTPAKPGESLVKTKIYKTWSRIVHGAMNPKSKDYIPGLSLHPPWRDFATFYQDVGQPPGPDMAFTRLDQAKGFYPDNCLWLSKTEAAKINAAYMKTQGTLVGRRGPRYPENAADMPQSQSRSLGTLARLPTLRKQRGTHNNQQLWLFPAESA